MNLLFVHSIKSSGSFVERAKRILKCNFGEGVDIHITTEFSLPLKRSDIYIFTERDFGKIAVDYASRSRSAVYLMENTGALEPLNARCIPTKREEHIFNSLAPDVSRGFYFFPYGFLYKHSSMGPTNEFGHRIDRAIEELKERGGSHKLIAIFGGSGAASFYCLFDEMFSHLLEQRLNEKFFDKGLTFSVMNFSQPGAVVMNEMMHFLLFCEELRPDYVIAHDGFNDLAFGVMSDTQLLESHMLTYQGNLERWSQILHNTSERSTLYDFQQAQIVNYPQPVIKAYLKRKQQFQRVVQSLGAKFIWALQPFIHSKKVLTEQEHDYLIRVAYQHQMAPVYRKMDYLYEELQIEQAKCEVECLLDFHELFQGYAQSDEMFIDFMHTTPQAEIFIAEKYSEVFVKDYQ